MAVVGTITEPVLAKILPGHFALAGRVLLYDGVCSLCNSGIRFVAKRDPDKNIMFCSVQSKAAEPYLKGIGLTRQDVLQRVVFVEYNAWSAGSTAILRAGTYMAAPWPLISRMALKVPEPFRDSVYDLVAAKRYAVFGRSRHCTVPPTGLLDRFVDRDELVGGQCSDEGMDSAP